MMQQMMEDEWIAAQAIQPDFILYHPKSLGSYHIAEKLNLPLALALPLPLYTPTSAFPVPMFANGIRLGGWFNRFTYNFGRLANIMYGGAINKFRVNLLGLSSQSRFADPTRLWNGAPLPILYPLQPPCLACAARLSRACACHWLLVLRAKRRLAAARTLAAIS